MNKLGLEIAVGWYAEYKTEMTEEVSERQDEGVILEQFFEGEEYDEAVTQLQFYSSQTEGEAEGVGLSGEFYENREDVVDWLEERREVLSWSGSGGGGGGNNRTSGSTLFLFLCWNDFLT